MRPGAIGIGAQKCASSWVHAVVGTHPEIGISEIKEVDFFSYYFDRGYQWYEGHFEEMTGKSLYFENSPSYFHDPRSAERARAYNPELKILALLRDPIKRAYSNHMHEIVKGHIPSCPFEQGLQNNPAYIEQGLYATHLERWFDVFPADQIMVMFAEEISAAPQDAARKVYSFFDVDPQFESPILHERRNQSDRARSPALRKSLRAGGDWLRRQGMEPVLARLKEAAPVAAVLSANRVEIRDEIPPMSAASKAMLTDIFAPEMERLAQLIGRDPLAWTTAPAEGTR